MTDKLWRITLDTNPEDCNLSCIMCEEHSPYSAFKSNLFETTGIRHRRMPAVWLEPVFAEAKALGVKEIIPSTMGEPLMYKHIGTIFSLAKQYDIKINLTTNGTFPGKSVEEWAAMIIPVTSDTKFSVNGASRQTAETVMQNLDFEKQMANIKEFVLHRNLHFPETGFYSRITLQLTFMQNNMHELVEIIKAAALLGIDRIKGHHLWVHFKENATLSFETSAASKLQWNLLLKEAFATVEENTKPDGSKVVLENFYPFSLTENNNENVPEHYNCPFLEKELWISATGKISPCCAPDEQRNSLGNFGIYPETKLSEVLSSEVYLNLVANYKKFDLCKICKMRKP